MSDQALREALEAAIGTVEQGMARSTKPDREGFLMTSHLRQMLAACPASIDLCHNGHPFVPGEDTDMVAEGRQPDSAWCNTCAEARKPAPRWSDLFGIDPNYTEDEPDPAPVVSVERVAEALHKALDHPTTDRCPVDGVAGFRECMYVEHSRLLAEALRDAGVFQEPGQPLLDRAAVSKAFRIEAGPWLTANRDAVTEAATDAVMALASPFSSREAAIKTAADAMYHDRWDGEPTEGQFAGERYDDAERQATIAVDAVLALRTNGDHDA